MHVSACFREIVFSLDLQPFEGFIKPEKTKVGRLLVELSTQNR